VHAAVESMCVKIELSYCFIENMIKVDRSDVLFVLVTRFSYCRQIIKFMQSTNRSVVAKASSMCMRSWIAVHRHALFLTRPLFLRDLTSLT